MNSQLSAWDEQAPFAVRFENHPTFLQAYLTGRVNGVDIALDFYTAIAKECANRHYQRVLVVDALEPDLSFLEICLVASRLFTVGLQGLTVAVVRLHSANPEHYQFGETMALNHGVNLKVFFQVARAERWLSSCAPSTPGLAALTPPRHSTHRKTAH